jgi:hypothetical protein
MVDVREMIDASDRRALVDSDPVAGGDSVGEEFGDGRRVQPLDVVAFQERVHDQLPVGGDVVHSAAVEMVAGQAEGVEFGRQRLGVGEVRGLAREPDQPASLAAGQLGKTVLALVEAGECIRPRHAGERTVERIGPGVIGADDPRRALRLAPLEQPGAAMAADVEEDVRQARLVAGEQERHAEAVVRHGHVVPRQQRRGRDHLRQSPEQAVVLDRETLRIGVGGGRDAGYLFAMRRLAARDDRGEGELALGRTLAGRHVHRR